MSDSVSVTNQPDEYAASVEKHALSIMDDIGMHIPPKFISDFVADQIAKCAKQQQMSVAAVVAEFPDCHDYAFDIAASLLTEIADERPGTNAFEHAGVVPFTILDVSTVLNCLQTCVQIGIDSGVVAQSLRPLTLAATSLSAWIVDILTQETPDLQPTTTVLMPLPGLAYVARVLESAGVAIVEERWQPEILQVDDLSLIGTEILKTAEWLKALKQQYGGCTEPTAWS